MKHFTLLLAYLFVYLFIYLFAYLFICLNIIFVNVIIDLPSPSLFFSHPIGRIDQFNRVVQTMTNNGT